MVSEVAGSGNLPRFTASNTRVETGRPSVSARAAKPTVLVKTMKMGPTAAVEVVNVPRMIVNRTHPTISFTASADITRNPRSAFNSLRS